MPSRYVPGPRPRRVSPETQGPRATQDRTGLSGPRTRPREAPVWPHSGEPTLPLKASRELGGVGDEDEDASAPAHPCPHPSRAMRTSPACLGPCAAGTILRHSASVREPALSPSDPCPRGPGRASLLRDVQPAPKPGATLQAVPRQPGSHGGLAIVLIPQKSPRPRWTLWAVEAPSPATLQGTDRQNPLAEKWGQGGMCAARA